MFGGPVPRLEKDRGWTGLGPKRTGIPRTRKDCDRSPVCGLLLFRKIQDRQKTGQDQSGPVLEVSSVCSLSINNY